MYFIDNKLIRLLGCLLSTKNRLYIEENNLKLFQDEYIVRHPNCDYQPQIEKERSYLEGQVKRNKEQINDIEFDMETHIKYTKVRLSEKEIEDFKKSLSLEWLKHARGIHLFKKETNEKIARNNLIRIGGLHVKIPLGALSKYREEFKNEKVNIYEKDLEIEKIKNEYKRQDEELRQKENLKRQQALEQQENERKAHELALQKINAESKIKETLEREKTQVLERIEIERLQLERQKLEIAEERRKQEEELQELLLKQKHELALAKEKTRQDEIRFAREKAQLKGFSGNIQSLKDYQKQQAKKGE